MKIAYVCADLGVPVFGCKGCSIHVQEVIRAFLNQGADVTLFTPRLGGEIPPDLKGLTVVQLPDNASTIPAQRETFTFNLNKHITSALAHAGPFEMVYERYSLWSFAAMEFARTQALPGILEVNAPVIEEQSRHRQLVNRIKAEQTTRRVFAAASTLIAVSAEVARYLDSYSETCERVHVISNGVNLARFQWPPAVKSVQSFIIGFVGTLKPWHGLDSLIDAFVLLQHKHSRARLLIVGDGPKRAELESALQSHGLTESAYFTGAVVPDQIPALLASMDVAVAPYPDSPDFYFSPLKVLEYMAAGLPVIASRIGQLALLIQHGRNGILCPPGEPVALAEALEQLLENPTLRHTLGNEARYTVQAHSWHSVAQRILELADITTETLPQQIRQDGLNAASK